jgi:hypothetical protein
MLKICSRVATRNYFLFSNTRARCDSVSSIIKFALRSSMSPKKLLTIFPPSSRFSLDIDATQFYTFFNCNIRIAEIDATHRKGRIGKWQLRKQPRRHPQRRPRRRPRKRSKRVIQPKGNTSGDAKASPEVFLRINERCMDTGDDATSMDCRTMG